MLWEITAGGTVAEKISTGIHEEVLGDSPEQITEEIPREISSGHPGRILGEIFGGILAKDTAIPAGFF